GSREFVGYKRENSVEVIQLISRAAMKIFPEFKNINIIRTFAGLRPYTPDKLPIIDKVNSIEGLYINAGHEGDGIALAPISGKIMSELVCEESLSVDINPMSLDRFQNGA